MKFFFALGEIPSVRLVIVVSSNMAQLSSCPTLLKPPMGPFTTWGFYYTVVMDRDRNIMLDVFFTQL